MKSVFRATTPADQAALAAFMNDVFHRGAESVTTRPEHMRWKYWERHPCWQGSRSYVIEREGRIMAHGAVWPGRMELPSRSLRALHLMDWAASAQAPGAGVALLRQIARLTDAAYAFGGTGDTLRILPVAGFQPAATARYFVRPLRPLKQALTHQHRNWKLPARFLRNAWYGMRPLRRPAGWSAERVAAADMRQARIPWPAPGDDTAVFHRGGESYAYFERCPVAGFAFYVVRHAGSTVGYFCLYTVPGQVRIADAWLASSHAADWMALYALATFEARACPGANEVATISGLPAGSQALEALGYMPRHRERLMICLPGHTGDWPARFHFQLLDTDLCFLHTGVPDYLS